MGAARRATVVDQEHRAVRPPARLRELLGRWLIAADPDGYAELRRATADDEADVELWKRDTGLVDLVARSLSAADAQACADRIEQLAQPTGPAASSTVGQRRRQALVDVLTGRITLPFAEHAAAGCCPPGSAAPCGGQVFVHVPLAAALGDSAEPAELVGYGPIDRALLADLLAAAPVLHRVWTDSNGTPSRSRTAPGHPPAVTRYPPCDSWPARRHPSSGSRYTPTTTHQHLHHQHQHQHRGSRYRCERHLLLAR